MNFFEVGSFCCLSSMTFKWLFIFSFGYNQSVCWSSFLSLLTGSLWLAVGLCFSILDFCQPDTRAVWQFSFSTRQICWALRILFRNSSQQLEKNGWLLSYTFLLLKREKVKWTLYGSKVWEFYDFVDMRVAFFRY